jgi:hypothetical protein
LTSAGFLDLLDRDDGARQLHQRQDAFLHARAARGRHDDQRRVLQHGQLGGRDKPFAHGHAHGAAHEAEIEGGDHHLVAAHGAMGDDDGVFLARF